MLSFLEESIIFGNIISNINDMINISEEKSNGGSLIGNTTNDPKDFEINSKTRLNRDRASDDIEKKKISLDHKESARKEDKTKAQNLRTEQMKRKTEVDRMRVAQQTGQDKTASNGAPAAVSPVG